MVCVSVVPLLVIVCAFILLLVGNHHHFELIEIHFSILVHVVSRNHLAGLILRQGDFTNLTKRRKRQREGELAGFAGGICCPQHIFLGGRRRPSGKKLGGFIFCHREKKIKKAMERGRKEMA